MLNDWSTEGWRLRTVTNNTFIMERLRDPASPSRRSRVWRNPDR